jgi:hypothetical protein
MQENKDIQESLTQDMLKRSWVDYHQAWNKNFWPMVIISFVCGVLGILVSLSVLKHSSSLQKYFLVANVGLANEPQNRTVVLAEESSVIDVVKKG